MTTAFDIHTKFTAAGPSVAAMSTCGGVRPQAAGWGFGLAVGRNFALVKGDLR
jgi:hypothetical protein